MSRPVFQLDLASGYAGWAHVPATAGPLVAAPPARFGSIPGCPPRKMVGRIEAIVEEVRGPLAAQGFIHGEELLCIERPPPTARRDEEGKHAHGAQAALGWSMGRLAGLVEAGMAGLWFDRVAYVDVSVWRARAAELALRWGAARKRTEPKVPPKIARVSIELTANGDRYVRYAACGHTYGPVICTPAELAQNTRLLTCPTCKPAKPKPPVSDWKARCCTFTEELYPEQYAAIVADARSRARKDQPDHELAGVADACEALWQGLAVADGCEVVDPG